MEKDFLLELHRELMKEFSIDYGKQKDLLIVDLVTVMGAIYCLDVSVTARKSSLKIEIPVYNLVLWKSLKNSLENLLKWVSSENFTIDFIVNKKEYEVQTQMFLNNPNKRIVTLFSGGLDSLTGAYANLENEIESDYLGFLNKNEEATKQRVLADFYRDTLNPTPEILLIEKPVSKKEYLIQSTRSLLYFALAIAKAYYNEAQYIYLYENGILSLNPTINNRFTTKTTHPKTVYEYNQLLALLGIDISIRHPFVFSTKGEKIDVMNENFKLVIKDTFTCGAGRSGTLKIHTGQCGVCIPCLLRKISISAFNNEKYDTEYYINYEDKVDEIPKGVYREEFLSNLNYFECYVKGIRDSSILQELKMKSRYYGSTEYMINTVDMLNRFAEEFERYKSKYGISRHSYTY